MLHHPGKLVDAAAGNAGPLEPLEPVVGGPPAEDLLELRLELLPIADPALHRQVALVGEQIRPLDTSSQNDRQCSLERTARLTMPPLPVQYGPYGQNKGWRIPVRTGDSPLCHQNAGSTRSSRA